AGVPDEPAVGLVDERGRLEGVARLLVGEAACGQPAQLVVHEREQVGGGLTVPGRGGIEQLGDRRHVGPVFRAREPPHNEKSFPLRRGRPYVSAGSTDGAVAIGLPAAATRSRWLRGTSWRPRPSRGPRVTRTGVRWPGAWASGWCGWRGSERVGGGDDHVMANLPHRPGPATGGRGAGPDARAARSDPGFDGGKCPPDQDRDKPGNLAEAIAVPLRHHHVASASPVMVYARQNPRLPDPLPE